MLLNLGRILLECCEIGKKFLIKYGRYCSMVSSMSKVQGTLANI